MHAEVDVAVVGAGAAGTGAGRILAKSGACTLLLVEARGRVGGRAHTVTESGLPLDLGCEWLHSADRNPITRLAGEAGFTVDRHLPDWTTRLSRSGEDAEAQAEWQRVRAAHFATISAEAARPGADRSLAAVVDRHGRWAPLLDAVSTWANGAELDRVSLRDNARYEDSGINWRLRKGYGTVIAALGSGLPLALETVLRGVDHRADPIRLETSRGVIAARRVILTVPSSVLAAEAIRFDPPLPEKVEAAAGLPLGLADKLFLSLDGNLGELPTDAHLVGNARNRETMSYQLRPFGRPMIACFFGGRFAAAMEREGAAGMVDFAMAELAALFGNGIRSRLAPLASTAWLADPFSRGSYSHALPGHAGDRARLATPVDDRLFFAGEACSPGFFSTAHGAFMSGERAAREALSSLGSR